jgi:hypothetical protein
LKDKRIIILILVLSLIFPLVSLGKRINIEQNNRGVELVIDSDDFQNLAYQEGVSYYELLKELKSAGVTTVSIPFMTWQDLENKNYVGIFSYREIGRLILSGNVDPLISALYRQGSPSETYIIVRPGVDISSSIDVLKQLIGYGRISLFGYNSNQVYIVKTTPSYLRGLPGGSIDFSLLETVKSLGYRVVFRPSNTPYIKPETISEILNIITPYKDITTALVFDGTEVLGYPDYLEDTANYLKEEDLGIAAVEFSRQKGIDVLTEHLGGRIVRLHSILPGEVYKLKSEDVLRRVIRAIRERNIRLIYMRPIYTLTGEDSIIEENLQLITSIKAELEKEGFNLGKASFFEKWGGFRFANISMGIGIASVILLIGFDILPYSVLRILVVISLLAGLGTTILPFTIFRKLLALGIASIFPILPIWLVLFNGREEKVLYKIIKIALLGIIGGVLVGGGLSSTDFMLQINQFMGVKVAHIIPFILLFIVIYLKDREPVNNILIYPLNILSFLVILLLAGGALFYIARTGNISSEAVWGFELKMRSALEQLMLVRPRTQEFLIGYPAIFLAIEFLKTKRELGIIFGFVSLITPISIINSFCHIHTPIILTLFRTFNGFILGCIVGYLVLLIVRELLKFIFSHTFST